MAYKLTSPRIGGSSVGTVDSAARMSLGETIEAREVTSGYHGQFMYVEASNSIAAFDAVAVKPGFKIAPLTITNGKTAIEVAFSPVAVPDKNTFTLVQNGGRPIVRLALGTQPNVPLFATATGGVLDDVSSSVVIQGVQAETQVTNSAGQATCVVRFPTAHHEPPG